MEIENFDVTEKELIRINRYLKNRIFNGGIFKDLKNGEIIKIITHKIPNEKQ